MIYVCTYICTCPSRSGMSLIDMCILGARPTLHMRIPSIDVIILCKLYLFKTL